MSTDPLQVRPICVPCSQAGRKCRYCLDAEANRPSLHITQGLPGCGKSTWAKAWRDEDPNRVRVCRDDLRRMIRGGWTGTRADEDIVTSMVMAGIHGALLCIRDVVADATHINPWDLERMIALGRQDEHLARVVLHQWTPRVQQCIRRDRQRPAGERVGGDVVWDMYGVWINTSVDRARLEGLADEVVLHD